MDPKDSDTDEWLSRRRALDRAQWVLGWERKKNSCIYEEKETK